ncbi:MAG: hypothetical protein WCF85_09850 [Rhodospirillaceae bacterium]
MTSQPETVEGWQAWDVAGRALTLAVVGRLVVPVIDRALALTLTETLGYDARGVALLLSGIEAGLWEAIGKIGNPGGKADDQPG